MLEIVFSASLAALTLGCTAETPTEPEPSAAVATVYAEPPENLCNQVGFDEVMARWDLSTPSWDQPGSDYDASSTMWYVRCSFVGVTEDDRFATVFGGFRPRGAVTLRVHHEVTDALKDYEQDARNYFERPEGSEPVEVTGWWDSGIAVTLNRHMAPIDAPITEPGAASLNSRLLVRHGNLVIVAYAQAEAPLEEADAVTDLLEDFVAAMLDETVEHLPTESGRD
jgi:hypothetical protein